MLEDSLRSYGAGRSLLVDRHGVVIAGNKTLEAAASIGLEDIQVVQTDGRTLVVVQRTDLDLATDSCAKALAIADNRTAQVSLDWDGQVIASLIEDGVDLSGLFSSQELEGLGAAVPAFEPVSEDEQGRLDQKKPVTCPACGHEFTT
jgi:hypothetical protein